jgi:hypothetical protein
MAGSYGVYGRNSLAWRNYAKVRGSSNIIVNDHPFTTWAMFKKANRDTMLPSHFDLIAKALERDGVYHADDGAFTVKWRGAAGLTELTGRAPRTEPSPAPAVR